MNSPEKIKLFIVDDHQMMIDGIVSLLKDEKKFEITGTALNGLEALKKIEKNFPDILLTDVSMPEMGGIELCKEIKQKFPTIKVLVLTMYNDREIVNEILQAGANGYILKNTGKQELLEALESLNRNDAYYSSEVVNALIENMKNPIREKQIYSSDLTEREIEIVRLIVKEFSSAEIAEKLFISPRTVETHRKNILRKTGVKNIVGLIKYAYDNKLVE